MTAITFSPAGLPKWVDNRRSWPPAPSESVPADKRRRCAPAACPDISTDVLWTDDAFFVLSHLPIEAESPFNLLHVFSTLLISSLYTL